MSTPRTSSLVLLVCALSAVLVLSNGCEPEDRPPPPAGGGPGGSGGGGGGNGNTDGGVLVVRSDGGTFAAKPTCTSGASCAGACPDGGVVCAGNCGFLAPVQLAFAGDPKDVAAGDVDGDGDDDLLTANNDGRAVAVLVNRGSGLFQTPSLWTAGREPTALALGDLNGDGALDLLVANSGDSHLAVHKGKGNGDFLAPLTVEAPGLNLNDVVVGGFGGTSRSVAVLRTGEQKLSVFPVRSSDGALQAAVHYDTSPSAYAMVAEDFNGDGRQDLALTHEATCGASSDAPCQSVGVLLGNGDGTFQEQVLTPTGGSPRGLVAARLDTDAVMDLLVADASRNQVLMLRGKNDGTFYAPVAYPVTKAPSRLVLADINRDTVRDVLVMSTTGNQVSLLLGQSGGTFAAQVPLIVWPQDVGLQGLLVSDFDDDRTNDLAVLTRSGIQLLWGICR